MNVMDLPDLVSESSDDDSDYDALDLSGGEENYEGDCECIPSPHRDCLVCAKLLSPQRITLAIVRSRAMGARACASDQNVIEEYENHMHYCEGLDVQCSVKFSADRNETNFCQPPLPNSRVVCGQNKSV